MKEAFEKIIKLLDFERKRVEHEVKNGRGLFIREPYTPYIKAIDIVEQVAEEYNQALTENNQGWLDVDLELPVNDDYILLSFKNFSIPQVGRYVEDEEGGAFLIGDDETSCCSYGLFVNAWQPLPKPYKGE